MQTSVQDILDDFSRTTAEIFSLEEFKDLLSSGKQLRIKYGVDVTAPYLHTGHAVNLWMMRKLQDLGHKVIFLIGDFTTRIGDPTGKNKTRPIIPEEEIEKNTELFIEQAKMVLRFDDPKLLEVRRNSEWFGNMPLSEFLELLSMVTHSKLISRDMFKNRLEQNQDIYMHELIYPILQGYDSYALDSDLTIIGSDQLFNEMLGRFFQDKFNQKPQSIITTKITPGIDGKAKQSKSLGNYIGLGHSPRDKFGRVMRLPDDLIIEYLEVYTDVSMNKIAKIENDIALNPMDYKKFLAEKIVSRYHGEEVAVSERKWFEDTFSKGNTPANIPQVKIECEEIELIDLLKLLLRDSASKSEIRRLILQGGIRIENEKVSTPSEKIKINNNMVVKIGKRKWFRILNR
ncbi:tyrosine--tRNA ligase [Bacillus pseudomycoides]|uniref:tyrosine--tRNA ligase n=1 Tax=Bacillus pseudomycoides TaxID=64104 RepID=UPI000BECAF95|nr:tyrosine--tRNA ligase [Bacillus pseudomycoides]PDZ70660.1 tyrosine--tRNA ligase [Bacillus pseudomycoides]